MEVKYLEKDCGEKRLLNLQPSSDWLDQSLNRQVHNFLYYKSNLLVGYLISSSFSPDEVEITGMVNPHYRRRGIFNLMLNEAIRKNDNSSIQRLLVVCKKEHYAAQSLLKKLKAVYVFSEYQMKLEENIQLEVLPSGFTIRKAKSKDFPQLIYMDAQSLSFPQGVSFSFSNIRSNSDNNSHSCYIAELWKQVIGKIIIIKQGDRAFISDFNILPEYRGRGFGRALLIGAIVRIRNEEQINCVLLEVAAENQPALYLYETCGFRVVTTYNYYELV